MAINLNCVLVLQAFVVVILQYSVVAQPSVTYNVQSYGAKPDGKTDSTKAFLSAWSAACGSIRSSIIYVPSGRYLLGETRFSGQCKNKGVTFQIDGTLVAPADYWVIGNAGNWLHFEYVNGVNIQGGILDGQGTALWNCKRAGKKCPSGATVCSKSLTFVIYVFYSLYFFLYVDLTFDTRWNYVIYRLFVGYKNIYMFVNAVTQVHQLKEYADKRTNFSKQPNVPHCHQWVSKCKDVRSECSGIW